MTKAEARDILQRVINSIKLTKPEYDKLIEALDALGKGE